MSEYGKDPAAYVEAQSDEAQAQKAFEAYCATDDGKIVRHILEDASSADLFSVFEAGWRAARAP